MSFVDSIKNNKLLSGTIDNVKNYLGITTQDKSSIKIDAVPTPFNDDLIIYTSGFIELFRLRGNTSFSLSANKSNSAVPSGKSITKGIVITNHIIQISDAEFTIKQEDLTTQQKINKTTSQARAYVGLMGKRGDAVISKGTIKLASIYQYVNGVSDLVKQAQEITKSFLQKNNNIQNIQTTLENILYSEENGSFVISYCGKLYHNMACIELSTQEEMGSLRGVSMKFEYSPTINNLSVKTGSVKGWDKMLDSEKNKAPTEEMDEKTFIREAVSGVVDQIREVLPESLQKKLDKIMEKGINIL